MNGARECLKRTGMVIIVFGTPPRAENLDIYFKIIANQVVHTF